MLSRLDCFNALINMLGRQIVVVTESYYVDDVLITKVKDVDATFQAELDSLAKVNRVCLMSEVLGNDVFNGRVTIRIDNEGVIKRVQFN